MTGEDAHLEAQYEDQQSPDVDDYDEDEEDEPCGLCGGWPCECDAIVDSARDRWADG